ncbi:male accessory gland serine protease inhibitor-like [Drosophila albomicans]|uniref:Male accessory gland serine protease inhibitor-like n=1 Tax=Drosophila albomicans TaxID=7291 RepID=A0A6P8W5X1_DROAB|nr:male accessory gland serine protease inhibitor-like [Drosophila albomicans]
MKFATLIFVLCALFGFSLAYKNAKCGLPPAVDGNGLIKCAAFQPSFSYYPAENVCKDFVYGGCGGNENRFASKAACEAECVN